MAGSSASAPTTRWAGGSSLTSSRPTEPGGVGFDSGSAAVPGGCRVARALRGDRLLRCAADAGARTGLAGDDETDAGLLELVTVARYNREAFDDRPPARPTQPPALPAPEQPTGHVRPEPARRTGTTTTAVRWKSARTPSRAQAGTVASEARSGRGSTSARFGWQTPRFPTYSPRPSAARAWRTIAVSISASTWAAACEPMTPS